MKLFQNCRFFFAVIFLATSIGSIDFAYANSDKDDVTKALYVWLKAVDSGKADDVVALYEDDSILIPTLSNQILDTNEGRKNYFVKFISLPKLRGKIDELYTRIHGHIAINSGLYTFYYEHDGKPVKTPARFTFVYEKIDGVWKILYHHSSKMPEDIKLEKK